MALYRKTYTRPLPKGAAVTGRNKQRQAQWRDPEGRSRTAPVTTGHDGSLRVVFQADTYTARFRDHDGQVRQISTGCRTKDAAAAVLAELVRKAELVKSGIITPEEQEAAVHAGQEIQTQIDEYLQQLCLRASELHVYHVRLQLARLVGDCKLTTLSDLQPGVVSAWLARQKRVGMGNRTLNIYRSALYGFATWCVENGRLQHNPLARVPRARESENQRRHRRALTTEEMLRLLEVARLRPVAEYGRATVGKAKDPAKPKRSNWERAPRAYSDLQDAYTRGYAVLANKPAFLARLQRTGEERALIYQTLIQTGLRKGELASITIGQLDLDSAPPRITLHAEDEKNGRGATIPLNDELAAALRVHVAGLGEGKPRLAHQTKLFTVPTGLCTILTRDLEAAGIPKRDGRGYVVDVHALRHTFGTHLCKAGVPLRTAQAAMRHSTPILTANVYTDPALLDVHGAVNALPALTSRPVAAQKKQEETLASLPPNPPPSATMTPGEEGGPLVLLLARNGVKPCQNLSICDKDVAGGGVEMEAGVKPKNPRIPQHFPRFPGEKRGRKSGAGDGTRTHDVQLGKLTFYH